jgi:hypothetical protein
MRIRLQKISKHCCQPKSYPYWGSSHKAALFEPFLSYPRLLLPYFHDPDPRKGPERIFYDSISPFAERKKKVESILLWSLREQLSLKCTHVLNNPERSKLDVRIYTGPIHIALRLGKLWVGSWNCKLHKMAEAKHNLSVGAGQQFNGEDSLTPRLTT